MPFGFGKPNVPKLKEKRDVEGLIKALEYEKDNSVRRQASIALGDLGDSRAIEPLIHTFNSHDTDERDWATEALGKIGEPAVDPLIRALSDTDWVVRSDSVQALGKIGGNRIVEPLTRALNDTNWCVRLIATAILVEIGDSSTVEPLITALNDTEQMVHKTAAEALPKIRDALPDPLQQARVSHALAEFNSRELLPTEEVSRRAYLVFLWENVPWRAEEIARMETGLNQQYGCPVQTIGSVKVVGPFPQSPNDYVITLGLMACEKFGISEQEVGDIGYRPGPGFGVIIVMVGGKLTR